MANTSFLDHRDSIDTLFPQFHTQALISQAQMASASGMDSRPQEDVILLTSSGPSAEYQGSALGLYRREGILNNSPYYRHVDTTVTPRLNMNKLRDYWMGSEETVYRNKKGEWCMGTGLDSFGRGLYNETKTDSVPLEGWKCWNGDASFEDVLFGDEGWLEDPHLKITKPSDSSFPLPCGTITIEATGNFVLRKEIEDCLGVYKPFKNDFSAGRRVFKHSSMNRFLMVRSTAWSVDNTEVNFMASGCAPSMCPADPRAMKSQRFDTTSWR